MIEYEARIKKWGNSFGMVIPKEIMENAHLKINENVKVLIVRENMNFEKLFGKYKNRAKKSTQKIKDQMRKELYG